MLRMWWDRRAPRFRVLAYAVLSSRWAALRSCRRSPEFVVPRRKERGPQPRQGFTRAGLGRDGAQRLTRPPRALTWRRPQLQSRVLDGEPGERELPVAATPRRGRTPRAASALSERCDARSAVRLEGTARAGASPRDAARPQERCGQFTGPRVRSLRDGRRRRRARKVQRHGWTAARGARSTRNEYRPSDRRRRSACTAAQAPGRPPVARPRWRPSSPVRRF
jgi:hypothetical protein